MANASHKWLRNSQMLLQISDFCASGSKNPQNFKKFLRLRRRNPQNFKDFRPKSDMKCFFIFKKFFAPPAQNASFVEFVVPQLPSLTQSPNPVHIALKWLYFPLKLKYYAFSLIWPLYGHIWYPRCLGRIGMILGYKNCSKIDHYHRCALILVLWIGYTDHHFRFFNSKFCFSFSIISIICIALLSLSFGK